MRSAVVKTRSEWWIFIKRKTVDFCFSKAKLSRFQQSIAFVSAYRGAEIILLSFYNEARGLTLRLTLPLVNFSSFHAHCSSISTETNPQKLVELAQHPQVSAPVRT